MRQRDLRPAQSGLTRARAPVTSVSYVVTIYNKTAALPFLVAGLAAQEGDFEREFIFVDDGSTDGSVPLLRPTDRARGLAER